MTLKIWVVPCKVLHAVLKHKAKTMPSSISPVKILYLLAILARSNFTSHSLESVHSVKSICTVFTLLAKYWAGPGDTKTKMNLKVELYVSRQLMAMWQTRTTAMSNIEVPGKFKMRTYSGGWNWRNTLGQKKTLKKEHLAWVCNLTDSIPWQILELSVSLGFYNLKHVPISLQNSLVGSVYSDIPKVQEE